MSDIQLKDLVQQTKVLAKQFAGLAKLAESLSRLDGQEERLAQQERRGAELESKIAARNAELERTLHEVGVEIDASRARLAEVVAEEETGEKRLVVIARRISAEEDKLKAHEAAHAAALKTTAEAQAEITAQEVAGRKIVLAELDKQLASKRGELERVVEEYDRFKQKVLG